jgi:hypothetical protein
LLCHLQEPEVVCDLLLRCTKPEKKEEDEPVLLSPPDTVNIVADLPVKKSKKNSAIYHHKPQVQVNQQEVKTALEVKVGASVECAICRLVMEYIDGVIAENATEVWRDLLKRLSFFTPGTLLEQLNEKRGVY